MSDSQFEGEDAVAAARPEHLQGETIDDPGGAVAGEMAALGLTEGRRPLQIIKVDRSDTALRDCREHG